MAHPVTCVHLSILVSGLTLFVPLFPACDLVAQPFEVQTQVGLGKQGGLLREVRLLELIRD